MKAPLTIPAFYINLNRDRARREKIERELSKARVKAERVAGIDGDDVPQDLMRFFFEDSLRVSNLSPGEMGCYASHLKTMQLVLDLGYDWALVLEDDVRLDAHLVEIAQGALKHVPVGWDFVKLCRSPQHGVRPLANLAAGRTLVRYYAIPKGTEGYFVSRAGAKKMLAWKPKVCPFDIDLQRPWHTKLEIFGVTPPPVAHDRTMPSSIKQRGGYSRAHRAYKRAKRQTLLYNLRTFGLLWWARLYVADVARRFADRCKSYKASAKDATQGRTYSRPRT